ncbi:hypothetical protein CDL15_Pgr011157 [Punica granatum]|uniref:Uncharacterized protein n=1 Tax=Punica granatum TaxID=22663 RepID=A0A218WZ38_PUNGR|nr:hypothetical protein CDL15_Pgr011157 [Punica granatum]
MKLGGGEELGGRERRFPSLGAAATVQEGAGGGGEHRLGCAVLETGVTRLGQVRIEGDFEFFGGKVSSFPTSDFEFNRRKSGELKGRNGGVLCGGVSRVDWGEKLRARGRDSASIFVRDPERELGSESRGSGRAS